MSGSLFTRCQLLENVGEKFEGFFHRMLTSFDDIKNLDKVRTLLFKEEIF